MVFNNEESAHLLPDSKLRIIEAIQIQNLQVRPNSLNSNPALHSWCRVVRKVTTADHDIL